MRRTETGFGRVALVAALLVGAMAMPSQAQQQSRFGLRISGDQPIQIESDRLEVRESENLAVFSGNVKVVQGPTTIRSGKMTVHYAAGGGTGGGMSQIERIEVDNKVYVKSNNQTATGDRGTFDMRREVLVLTGNEVVLTEGTTVIVGCSLTVQMSSGLANLDGCGRSTSSSSSGRVKMLLQPQSQGQ
jgi:lipopolysaccharide export system protein LptA